MVKLNFLAEIRDTEQQAAEIISQARENARLLQDDARQQAAEIIQSAREEAIVLQQKLINDAENEAVQITRLAHERALAETAGHCEISDILLDSTAHLVVERIVNENAHR